MKFSFRNLSNTAKTTLASGVLLLVIAGASSAQGLNYADDPTGGTEAQNSLVTPTKVVQTGRTNSATAGPTQWGHITVYNLEVIGSDGNPYGAGVVAEHFSLAQTTFNATYKTALVQQGAPGTPDDTVKPCSDFHDTNGTYLNMDTGSSTFWYSFPQNFTDAVGKQVYPLNTHTVSHYQGYATRNY